MNYIAQAIIASTTVVSMAYMHVNAVNEVLAACVGAFGLGVFLMIPKEGKR